MAPSKEHPDLGANSRGSQVPRFSDMLGLERHMAHSRMARSSERRRRHNCPSAHMLREESSVEDVLLRLLAAQRCPISWLESPIRTTMFEPFSRLPTELRIHIWELTVFPRLVHIATRTSPGNPPAVEVICVKSNTACPAVMQACRESRNNARYQKAFTYGSEPRYIWINFEYDMINCHWDEFDRYSFRDHRADVRRLRVITTDEASLWLYSLQSEDARRNSRRGINNLIHKDLPSIQEVHIFDAGRRLKAIIYSSASWVDFTVPVGSIKSKGLDTGIIVIDAKFYRNQEEPAKDFPSLDSDGNEDGGNDVERTIRDMTPPSERHLVRLRVGESISGIWS